MTVYAMPSSVTPGTQVTVSIVPSPYLLTAGTKYLGSIAYTGGPAMPAPTIVRIDK